jgi:serine/threonine-protein kinase
MAPEQIDANSRCDGRADLYALGAVIYELLTGRRLFHGRTTTDIRQGRMIRPPMYELSAALGASLAQVIARCLHADPSARYADAHALLDDLRYAMHDAAIAPRENVEG